MRTQGRRIPRLGAAALIAAALAGGAVAAAEPRARSDAPVGSSADAPSEAAPIVTRRALLRHLWFWSCAEGAPHQAYMVFRDDGVVLYDYHKAYDFAFANGRWSFENGHLLLDFNNGFAVDRFDDAISETHLIGRPARTRPCPFVELRREADVS